MLKTALQYMNVFWNSPVDSAVQTATVDCLIGFFNQSLCIHESCFFLRECRESFQVHLVLLKLVSPVCFLEANPYINRNKRDLWTEKTKNKYNIGVMFGWVIMVPGDLEGTPYIPSLHIVCLCLILNHSLKHLRTQWAGYRAERRRHKALIWILAT